MESPIKIRHIKGYFSPFGISVNAILGFCMKFWDVDDIKVVHEDFQENCDSSWGYLTLWRVINT